MICNRAEKIIYWLWSGNKNKKNIFFFIKNNFFIFSFFSMKRLRYKNWEYDIELKVIAANHFIFSYDWVKYLQSYGLIIVKINWESITLDEKYWNYSKTTSRYRCLFLEETTKETKKKIDSWEYKLWNLN